MKRYWYIPTGNKVWLDAAELLYKDGIGKPVMWTGDDRHYKSAKKIFGKAVVRKHNLVFYPEELERISYKSKSCDFFLSENYLRAKDRCLKMMDRLDLYGSFSRIDRDTAFNKLVIWVLNKFEETKPDALIVSENPHSHTHYLIYEICLYQKIAIIKFNTWLCIPVLYAQDLKTGKRLKVRQKTNSELSNIFDQSIIDFINNLADIKKGRVYVLPAIKIQLNEIKIKTRFINFFQVILLAQIKEFWFQFRKYFYKNYYPINPYKFGYFTRLRIRKLREYNLAKMYKKSTTKKDLNKKYVFFALSFEPERTTNPDGNQFHDQIIALSMLRKFTPCEYQIYVKEHPTQFMRADRGSRGRSPLFYETIKNIHGVSLVSDEIETVDYIRKSNFVATISGSAGFEAAVIGKRSLVFGDTWYEGCPNIVKWHEDLKFNEFKNRDIASPKEIREFLIREKNRFTVAGCQNISAQKRFKDFLNNKVSRKIFKEEEIKGVSNIMKDFLLNL